MGRSLLLPNGRATPPPDEEDEGERSSRRILPPVPTYLSGEAYRVPRGTGPVVARDRLYDHMCDWDYHTLEEFDSWMPEREWVKAVVDLLHFGFTFDRQGVRLRLRRADVGERRPSVVDLLSGVTVGDVAGGDREVVPVFSGADEARHDNGSPFSDEPDDTPEEERLVLDESRSTYLRIGDFVTGTHTILARRGMGKTYLAMVVAESLLESRIEAPFVVVDPTGCWFGLLSQQDGTPSPHEVALFGGEAGQYPLAAGDGRLVARMVVDLATLSCVLDLSQLRQEEQHEFVADFAGELYHCNRTPRHVFFDEADIFAPQRLDKSSKHQGRCLATVDNLTRRGRFRGVGETLISQRPALVNKNLLSQVGSMFILHMIAPHDLDAVDAWLHENIGAEVRRQCRSDLPVLPRGTVYHLRGGEGGTFRKFKVRPKHTFDSSRTPELGEEREVPVLSKLPPELDAKVRFYFQADQEVPPPTVLEKELATLAFGSGIVVAGEPVAAPLDESGKIEHPEEDYRGGSRFRKGKGDQGEPAGAPADGDDELSDKEHVELGEREDDDDEG